MVLRRIFGSKKDEVRKKQVKYHSGRFIICIHQQISLGRTNKGK
jgi:hypothetical protein